MTPFASSGIPKENASLSATVRQYKAATGIIMRWLFMESEDMGDPTCGEILAQIYKRHNDSRKERPSKSVRRASKTAIQKRIEVNQMFEQPALGVSTSTKINNQKHKHFIKLLELFYDLLIQPWQDEDLQRERPSPSASTVPTLHKVLYTENIFAVLQEELEDDQDDSEIVFDEYQDTGGEMYTTVSATSQKRSETIECMRLSEFDDRDVVVAILEEMEEMKKHFDNDIIPSIIGTEDRQSLVYATIIAKGMDSHMRTQSKKLLARLDKSCTELDHLITDDLLDRHGFGLAGQIMAKAMLGYRNRYSRKARRKFGENDIVIRAHTEPNEEKMFLEGIRPRAMDAADSGTKDGSWRFLTSEYSDEFMSLNQGNRIVQILCQYIRQEFVSRRLHPNRACNPFIQDLQGAFDRPRALDKLVVIFGVGLFASLELMMGSDPMVISTMKTVLQLAIATTHQAALALLKLFPAQPKENSPQYGLPAVTPHNWTLAQKTVHLGEPLSNWEIGNTLIHMAALSAGETLTVLRNPVQDQSVFAFVIGVLYLQTRGASIRSPQFRMIFDHLTKLFFENRQVPATIKELHNTWREFVSGNNTGKLGRKRAERAIRNPALSVLHMLVQSSYTIDADIATYLLKADIVPGRAISGVGALCYGPFPVYEPGLSTSGRGEKSRKLRSQAPPGAKATSKTDRLQADMHNLDLESRVRSLREYEGFSITKTLEPLERVLRHQLRFGFCPLKIRASAVIGMMPISCNSVVIAKDDCLRMKQSVDPEYSKAVLARVELTFIACMKNPGGVACILYPRLYTTNDPVVFQRVKAMEVEIRALHKRSLSDLDLNYPDLELSAEQARMVGHDDMTDGMSFQRSVCAQAEATTTTTLAF